MATMPLTGSETIAASFAGVESDDTGQRLVAAAAEVFAAKGYEGAGVQEIARRAGLTTGAIYSRFSGKAELLSDAIAFAASPELALLFRAESSVESATAIVREAGTNLIDRRGGAKSGLLLEAFVAARRDPEVAAMLRPHVDAIRETFCSVIERGRADGDVDPDLDAHAIVHFCHAVALGFLVYDALDLDAPAPTDWARVVDRLVGAMAPAVNTSHDDVPLATGQPAPTGVTTT